MVSAAPILECVCGDGDGVGFCFGVRGISDDCKACLALPPKASCLAAGGDDRG